MHRLIVDLFDEVQHGDKEHREWLRDKFIEFFNKRLGITTVTKEDFIIREPKTESQDG